MLEERLHMQPQIIYGKYHIFSIERTNESTVHIHVYRCDESFEVADDVAAQLAAALTEGHPAPLGDEAASRSGWHWWVQRSPDGRRAQGFFAHESNPRAVHSTCHYASDADASAAVTRQIILHSRNEAPAQEPSEWSLQEYAPAGARYYRGWMYWTESVGAGFCVHYADPTTATGPHDLVTTELAFSMDMAIAGMRLDIDHRIQVAQAEFLCAADESHPDTKEGAE